MADKNVRHLRPLDGGGEPPDMEQRLRSLEQEVHVIRETMATREDLHGLRAEMHSLLRQQTMWTVGSIIAMGSLVFAIVRFAGG